MIKTDNHIINILIFYVILLIIPIIKPELYDLFNAYFTTIILFFVMLLRYYKESISMKKLGIILSLLLLQYIALSTSGLVLAKENIILPLIYTINVVSLFCLTESIKIDKSGLIKFYKFYLYLSVGFCIYNFVVNYEVITSLLGRSGSLAGLMIASAFRNRNAFGFVLVWAIVTGVYLYNYTRQKKYLLYLSFIFLNLVITFSRNSMITSFIFIVIFAWLFFREQRQKLIYGLLAFFGSVFLLMLNKRINALVINAIIRADIGLTDRDVAWHHFFENMGLREYLIGSGVGSTQIILEPINFYSYHNSILDLLSTGGVIFLALYLIAVFSLIRYYYRAYNEHPLEASVFVASITAFQFYCMFESIVLQVGIGFVDVLVALFLYVLPLLYLKKSSLLSGS